ncbi:MAG: prepilin peptidase [Planctomycetota bacterium]
MVIYRLPAGRSLVHPGSRCPACDHPIRWHDNVPVFGWFFLGGRCRDCSGRISPRYPLVEAVTAGLFVLIGAVEGLSGGANLPLASLGSTESAGIAAYHLLLLCTVLAAVLMEYDGHRLPPRLFLPALVVGWSAPIIWPHLHPVAPCWGLSAPIAGLAGATAGGAAGLVLGEVARRLVPRSGGSGLPITSACAGLFLGWQAALALTAATVLVQLPFSTFGKWWSRLGRVPPTTWLGLAAVAWIVLWGEIVDSWSSLRWFLMWPAATAR